MLKIILQGVTIAACYADALY